MDFSEKVMILLLFFFFPPEENNCRLPAKFQLRVTWGCLIFIFKFYLPFLLTENFEGIFTWLSLWDIVLDNFRTWKTILCRQNCKNEKKSYSFLNFHAILKLLLVNCSHQLILLMHELAHIFSLNFHSQCMEVGQNGVPGVPALWHVVAL